MSALLLSFFTSLISILLIIRFQHLHTRWSGDAEITGPQKFHHTSVPRIGGLGIFTALLITGLEQYLFDGNYGQQLLLLILSSSVVGRRSILRRGCGGVFMGKRLISCPVTPRKDEKVVPSP